MKFHDRFKELLEQYKKNNPDSTQAQLANLLGMTPQAFSYYLNGREPSYEILISLSNLFDVSVDYLIGKSEYKNNLQKTFAEDLKISRMSAFSLSHLQSIDKGLSADGVPAKYGALESLELILASDFYPKFFSSLKDYLDVEKCEFINEVVFKAWIEGVNHTDENYLIGSDFDSKYIFLNKIQEALEEIRNQIEEANTRKKHNNKKSENMKNNYEAHDENTEK